MPGSLLFCINAPSGNNPFFLCCVKKSSAETKKVFDTGLLDLEEPLPVCFSPLDHAVRPSQNIPV